MADEIELTAHNFLKACYLNQELPVSLRMKAAQIAIGYEQPKLQAIAHYAAGNLGEQMQRARERVAKHQQEVAEQRLIGAHNGELINLTTGERVGEVEIIPPRKEPRRF